MTITTAPKAIGFSDSLWADAVGLDGLLLGVSVAQPEPSPAA